MKYGLIGEKLSHSFSKEIHESLADYAYEILELSPNEVEPFIKAREFDGINVTIPYKEKVIPFLDEISNAARKIGAVNTITKRDGKLYGDNTDFYGMREMILSADIDVQGKKALILGTGGTSKTARAVLTDLGARCIVTVSRRAGENTVTYEAALELHSDAEIIVNTTPVGMYPNINDVPIDVKSFPELCGVVDVIYNPLRTGLVLEAEAEGIPAVGGLMMLIGQAAKACEIFLGKEIDEEKFYATVRGIFEAKENIVLIGMPGCGKSTLGRIISEMTGRKLVDTDEIITEMTGKSPSEIITSVGEREFRRIETEAVKRVSAMSGVVIATGGGVVTRKENVPYLRRNGRLVYLHCYPSDITPTPNRPLSSSRSILKAMYEIRHPLYEAAADASVEISHKISPDISASEVIDTFTELI